MKIGCCTSLFGEEILRLAETGADYAEIGLFELVRHTAEEVRERAELLARVGVHCEASNVMFPGELKLTGEEADLRAAERYLEDVLEKAALLGVKSLALGSGGSRRVPEGFSRERAWGQLRTLCREVITPAFSRRGMVCCIEPLRREECNILNTCAETVVLVREVGSEAVRLLVDLYHYDWEQEPREALSQYGALLGHAHIASAQNDRALPRPEDGEDYAVFFRQLKKAGYAGRLSLEGKVCGGFVQDVSCAVSYLSALAKETGL